MRAGPARGVDKYGNRHPAPRKEVRCSLLAGRGKLGSSRVLAPIPGLGPSGLSSSLSVSGLCDRLWLAGYQVALPPLRTPRTTPTPTEVPTMPIPHTRPPLLAAVLVAVASATAFAAATTPTPLPAQSLPTIEDHTEGTTAMEGFSNLYWDNDTGALYWEIADLDSEFLYQISMGSGLGSNPVGIDRGQLRGTHVFEARRIGPRVLLIEPNYEFRAITENTAEARAVRDAFPPSVHWGFDIVARTGDRVLVDATEFFMRDARGVVNQIA